MAFGRLHFLTTIVDGQRENVGGKKHWNLGIMRAPMDVSNRMGVPLCSNNSERVIIHEESLEFCLCQPIPVPYLAFRDPLIPVPSMVCVGFVSGEKPIVSRS